MLNNERLLSNKARVLEITFGVLKITFGLLENTFGVLECVLFSRKPWRFRFFCLSLQSQQKCIYGNNAIEPRTAEHSESDVVYQHRADAGRVVELARKDTIRKRNMKRLFIDNDYAERNRSKRGYGF